MVLSEMLQLGAQRTSGTEGFGNADDILYGSNILVHITSSEPGTTMFRGYSSLSLRSVAGWGFLLNLLWEFLQCTVFYNMWDWGFWRGTVWMWGAILGDVVIVLGVVLIATILVGAQIIESLDKLGLIALLVAGFFAAISLEWAAQALNLWTYSNMMPTIHILGHAVGLSPILQVTAVPAVSVYLAYYKKVRHRSDIV